MAPAGAVVLFAHHARSTREEALALRSLAVDHGWRHVLVVTSNFHTRRTRFIFRRVWPAGSEFRVISARDVSFDPDSWWHSRVGIKLVFMETVAICVAAWELSGHDAGSRFRSVRHAGAGGLAKNSIYKPSPLY